MISKQELRRMYWNEGMSTPEIGREFCVTYNIVFYWMKKYGINRRSISESKLLKSSMPSKEDLRRMYWDEGMSTKEIGREIDVPQPTVQRWMEKYGIDRRDISESLLNGNFSGERASAWKNGLSFGKYCYKFNNSFKELVRVRDDYTCQLCGYEQKLDGQRLSIHHIHYDKENCYPDVIALCHSCNGKVNGNRNEWEAFFEDDLARKGLLSWRP